MAKSAMIIAKACLTDRRCHLLKPGTFLSSRHSHFVRVSIVASIKPTQAKRFYEFVTTPESLIHSGRNYYRLPVRTDIDRKQLPDWMDVPFTRMPLDWEPLRKQGNEWPRYWDTEIRGRTKQ